MPPKPFKPPRPISSTNTSTATKNPSKPTRTVSAPSTTTSARPTKPSTSKSKTKSKSTTPILPDLTDSDDNNNITIQEDIDLLSSGDDDDNNKVQQEAPTFPIELISRLLHEHFQDTDTRITKEALEVVCRYVDVFAREAVARCCFGKEAGDGDAEGMGMEGDFLEVSFGE